MNAELAGRAALITGGGRGIGASVAQALAEEGCRVCVASRGAADRDAVRDELVRAGHEARSADLDVADPVSVERLFAELADEGWAPEVLVNNAGTASAAPVSRLTLEEWDRLMAVNARGTFLCTRAALPSMREAGWGRIVNIASVAGLSGAAYVAGYAASKHAVIGFTRSVAAELAESGVTINAVCPGYVDTPMTEASVRAVAEKTGRAPGDALEAILATAGQFRLITPEEVASAVVYLGGAGGAGTNGAALVIDGGGRWRHTPAE